MGFTWRTAYKADCGHVRADFAFFEAQRLKGFFALALLDWGRGRRGRENGVN